MNNKNLEFYINAFTNVYKHIKGAYDLTRESKSSYDDDCLIYRCGDEDAKAFLEFYCCRYDRYSSLSIVLNTGLEPEQEAFISFEYDEETNMLEFAEIKANGLDGLESLAELASVLYMYGVEMPKRLSYLYQPKSVKNVQCNILGDIGKYYKNDGIITSINIE